MPYVTALTEVQKNVTPFITIASEYIVATGGVITTSGSSIILFFIQEKAFLSFLLCL